MFGFLDTITNSIENPATPISSAAVLAHLGMSGESAAGVQVTEKKGLGLSTVWRAVSQISGDAAKVPVDVFRREGEEDRVRDRDHPASKVLRRPFPGQTTRLRFRRTLLFHALYRGNGYALVIRDKGERPVRLILLPPTPTTYPVVVEGQKWYVTTIKGVQKKFKPEDVVHIPGLSYDGLEGLDVLNVMVDVFGLEIAKYQSASNFFKRGTQSSGFITAPNRIKEEELRELRRNWKTMTGVDNMYEIGVLYGGQSYVPITTDPAASQLVESMEFGVRRVANVFLLPPHMLGDSTRTSYNSLEMETQGYVGSTLDLWFVTMEQEYEEKLLTEAEKETGDVFIEHNRNALIRVDFATRMMGYSRLREMGVLTANQVAAKENLPSHDQRGEQLFVPANWNAVGEDGMPVAAQRGQVNQAANDPNASVLTGQTHKEAIAEIARRLIAVEKEKVAQAARKPDGFLDWLDAYYMEYERRLHDATERIAEAYFAAVESVGGRDASFMAAHCYVAQSRKLLLAASGRALPDELENEVRREVSHWEQRADELAGWIVQQAR